jgi:hypothetical protein
MRVFTPFAVVAFVGCSSSSAPTMPTGADSGRDGANPRKSDASPMSGDSGSQGSLAIETLSGAPLSAAAGDALRLQVVDKTAAGSSPLAAGATVAWSTPGTIVTQDPYDAGPGSVLPAPGTSPTAVFVANPYRPDRTDYTGTLFVLDPGKSGSGTLTVTADVTGRGKVSATITVTATPPGSADAGAFLYRTFYKCEACHGQNAEGSPIPDAGDASTFIIDGKPYPFPAPGLNNASPGGSPNLAADPTWNAALLAVGAQGDFDNNGVALRLPMPDWLGTKSPDGGTIGAQDFAHIYAFLKSQTP